MSSERTPTADATPSEDPAASPTRTDGYTPGGRDDPRDAPGEAGSRSRKARAPRQFEPTCRRRLENLFDGENAYSG